MTTQNISFIFRTGSVIIISALAVCSGLGPVSAVFVSAGTLVLLILGMAMDSKHIEKIRDTRAALRDAGVEVNEP